ncbi:MAG: isoprenylcysteine carboxylmethyltransferase family protein [Leptolinea sp.]
MISSFLLIVIAFGVYGIVHSLLASFKAKDLAEAWLGPVGRKWFRMAYNIFATISLLPVLALAVILPDRAFYNVLSPWSVILFLMQLVGVGISIFAVAQTDLLHFAGVRQLVEKTDATAHHHLETGGLYRYVRHPIYSGGLLFLWASPEMSWNSLALKAAFTLYFIFGAMVEEKKLVSEFGDAYRAYRMRTPMLIPGLKKPA